MGIQLHDIILVLATGLLATTTETLLMINNCVSRKKYEELVKDIHKLSKKLGKLEEIADCDYDSEFTKIYNKLENHTDNIKRLNEKIISLENVKSPVLDQESINHLLTRMTAVENALNVLKSGKTDKTDIPPSDISLDQSEIFKKCIQKNRSDIDSILKYLSENRPSESKVTTDNNILIRLDQLENKINRLEGENRELREQLNARNSSPAPSPSAVVKPADTVQSYQQEKNNNYKKSDISVPSANKNTSDLINSELCIVPDETYVGGLIEGLESLKDLLINRDYEKMKSALKGIDDYDDAEEVMTIVHENMEKYIFKSFSKVDSSQKKIIDSYLIKAGYSKINLKEGDSYKENITYFENVFYEPASSDLQNGKIKEIVTYPYIINYSSDGEVTPLILHGICIGYK